MGSDGNRSTAAPSVDEVSRIVAIASPVIRNLEITHCYSLLAAAFAARSGDGANWCTYATWASRQAGRTIRGEDLLEQLERRLGEGRWLLHPIAKLWRRLLRRGLFQSETRIGRLTAELHTPFDAFERASDVVGRGNLKVFEEIGLEFARYLQEHPPDAPAESPSFQRFLDRLRPGDPPDGQRYLRQAFACYERKRLEHDPKKRAQLVVVANLEVGLDEQNAPAAGDPRGARRRLRYTGGLGEARARGTVPVGGALVASCPASGSRLGRHSRGRRAGAASRLAREVITESFMVLSLPGRVLALGTHRGTRTRRRSDSPRTPS